MDILLKSRFSQDGAETRNGVDGRLEESILGML